MSCGWFEATRFFYAPLTQNGAKNGAKKNEPPPLGVLNSLRRGFCGFSDAITIGSTRLFFKWILAVFSGFILASCCEIEGQNSSQRAVLFCC
jgi:hypothetical protein